MSLELVKFNETLADRIFSEKNEMRKLGEGYQFCEGPVWDIKKDRLYFTDFFRYRIFQWTEKEGVSLYRVNSNFAVGLSMDQDGRLVAAEGATHSIAYTDHERSTMIAGSYKGKMLCGPNDIIVARNGDFLFTDQYPKSRNEYRELEHNGVYRVNASGIRLLDDGIGRPNGLALSPDESILYVNDTDTQEVFCYKTKDDGSVSKREVFCTLDKSYGPGAPDGMKVDIEGNVYVTGPGGIWVISPDGKPAAILRCPEYVGNFSFGGPDSKTIFITASTSLYMVPAGIPGIVPWRK